MRTHDVIIVGGGVAGLSCAAELRRIGVSDVRLFEREREAGGIPRHCGHLGFGLREFGWIDRGPDYAKRLIERAEGVALSVGASVLALEADGIVAFNAGAGIERAQAKAVVLAMGARETPRSARLVSGSRPLGVMNTGTLQQMIYLHHQKPFERPVILGSELVSFSALLTLRHAGIRARAMIEENSRITARRPADWVARAVFGTPIILGARRTRILGAQRVLGVEFDRGRGVERIDCDGVIVSGKFRPENALLSGAHLAVDPMTLGPSVDQTFRCSDPRYFAAGNVLRGIETAGQCWREGKAMARTIAHYLDGALREPRRLPVACGGALSYAYPQFVDRHESTAEPLMFKARVGAPTRGRIRVLADGKEIWSKRMLALPERRLAWQLPEAAIKTAQGIEVRMDGL
jgi:thioredoxin reductase